MAKLLKLRRGSTSQHSSFTGAEGEVTIDTTKDTAVVHDGSQAGGRPLAREDMSNVSSASIAGRLNNDSIAVSKIAGGTLPSDVKIQDANVSGNLTIESADIVNGTIVNEDINASANIDNSKLSDSGVSAGSVGSSTAIPIITVNSKGIVTATNTTAVDSTTIANGSAAVAVSNNGPITSNANHDFNAGIDVTGNITVSGTVDGRDVASDGSKLDGIESGATGDQNASEIRTLVESASDSNVFTDADHNKLNGIESGATADQTAAEIRTLVGNASDSNVFTDSDHARLDALTTSNGALVNGVTATTQSSSDSSTKVATTAFVGTAVSNLVDSSPSALNTLNELAAAINDDANFSTTVNNNIATKMPKSGGEFTGNVTVENVVPDADSSRSLGTSGNRFLNIYADNLYGSGANISGIPAANLTGTAAAINGSNITNLNAANLTGTLPAIDGSALTGIQGIPSGVIMIWSGAQNAIPSGFVLCNGSNSTPDLRDRFVVGAGNSYGVGNTGGAATATDTVSISGSDTVNISVSGNAAGNIQSVYSNNSSHFSNSWKALQTMSFNYSYGRLTIPFSGSGSDTVTISGTDTVSIDNRPPYYALCYIMKT